MQQSFVNCINIKFIYQYYKLMKLRYAGYIIWTTWIACNLFHH